VQRGTALKNVPATGGAFRKVLAAGGAQMRRPPSLEQKNS